MNTYENLLKQQQNLWDKIYSKKRYIDEKHEILSISNRLYFMFDKNYETWIPNDIKQKAIDVKNFYNNYFDNLYKELEELENKYKELEELEKQTCTNFKNYFILNISLYFYSLEEHKKPIHIKTKFIAKSKKAYVKELDLYTSELCKLLNQKQKDKKLSSFDYRVIRMDSFYDLVNFDKIDNTLIETIEKLKEL